MTQNNQQGNTCAEEYIVKRGDSFYLIAHKLGVPLRDLLAANRDIHPARLMVGDVLCIPREEDDCPQTGGLGGGSGNGNTGSGGSGGTSGGTGNGSTGSGGTGSGNGSGNGNTGSGNTSDGTGSGNTGSGSTGDGTGSGNTGSGSTGGGNGSGNTGSGSTGGGSGNGNTGSGSTGGGNGSGNTGVSPCPGAEEIIVQKGQTIADIQLRNLVSLYTMEQANPNVDLDELRTGQTLCVPAQNVPCPLPTSYTLAAGETLEAVAVRFNLPVASLLHANPCLAPQDFEAGVTVSLPD